MWLMNQSLATQYIPLLQLIIITMGNDGLDSKCWKQGEGLLLYWKIHKISLINNDDMRVHILWLISLIPAKAAQPSETIWLPGWIYSIIASFKVSACWSGPSNKKHFPEPHLKPLNIQWPGRHFGQWHLWKKKNI